MSGSVDDILIISSNKKPIGPRTMISDIIDSTYYQLAIARVSLKGTLPYVLNTYVQCCKTSAERQGDWAAKRRATA